MGYAIRYFSSNGTVSIPLTDSQDYDLIVDINDSLKRVQVKTTGQKNKEFFKVTLCTKGGNKSRYNIKQFDNKKMDILYCLTSDGKEYIIPTSEIASCPPCSPSDKVRSALTYFLPTKQARHERTFWFT